MSADHPLAKPVAGGNQRETVADVRGVFSAKVLAEVAQADALAPGSDAVPARGNPLARVLVLKGLAGPAEASGGTAVSGADGEAIVKALVALGYRDDDQFFALTRPEPGTDEPRRTARVRALIEAIDPIVVVALDAVAVEDVSAAIGEALSSGRPLDCGGRHFVAVDGMEASLGDAELKKKVWRQLQSAAPPGPIY